MTITAYKLCAKLQHSRIVHHDFLQQVLADARIIVNERGDQRSLAGKVEELLEDVAEVSERLGSYDALQRVRNLLANPNFKRQRTIYAETGSLDAVVDACIEELREDRPTVI